jgi:hypothetical protein
MLARVRYASKGKADANVLVLSISGNVSMWFCNVKPSWGERPELHFCDMSACMSHWRCAAGTILLIYECHRGQSLCRLSTRFSWILAFRKFRLRASLFFSTMGDER